jgi:hypothetical protein
MFLFITTNSFSQLSNITQSIHLFFNSGKYSDNSSAYSIHFILTILAHFLIFDSNVVHFHDTFENTSAFFLLVEKLTTS